MHITFCIIVTTLHTVHISAYVHVALAVSSYEDVSKKQNFTLVNLTLESKTSVILENKPEGELSSELGIEEPSTCNCKYFARPKTMQTT